MTLPTDPHLSLPPHLIINRIPNPFPFFLLILSFPPSFFLKPTLPIPDLSSPLALVLSSLGLLGTHRSHLVLPHPSVSVIRIRGFVSVDHAAADAGPAFARADEMPFASRVDLAADQDVAGCGAEGAGFTVVGGEGG